MSREAYKRVWESTPDRRGTRKLALLALAEFADPLGVCWPSIPTIAQLIGETQDWAATLMKQAEADGDVMRNPGRGRGNTTVYGLAVGLDEQTRHRLAITVAHTVVKKGVRYIDIDGQLVVYTPGSEDQIIRKGVLQTPFSGEDVENVEVVPAASPPPPQPASPSRPARRPPVEAEHIRFLRVEEGIVSAEDFAHLDPEALMEDYRARRADGQPKGAIIKYWKRYPPTKEDHYRGRQHEENSTLRPAADTRPADRPGRKPKPGDPEYYGNRS